MTAAVATSVGRAPDPESAYELQITGLTKSFIGVQALKGVNVAVRRGSIHALAGQNGAGKSTLVKILSGAESPDGGRIDIGGHPVHFDTPGDAQHAGVQTIYQELSLVPDLSVAENIFLGELPSKTFPGVDWPRMRAEAAAALARIGFSLDVRRPVSSYSIAEQQAVELAKALRKQARIILLDEPTSTLPAPDVARLFDVLRQVAAQGVTLLYISHRMDELFSLCDHVTVLRDGRDTATFDTAASTPHEVVAAMVGEGLAGSLAESAISGERSVRLGTGDVGPTVLSVSHASTLDGLRDITFDLHRGEVLGLSGLVGSGQSELANVLAGADRLTAGTVSVDGRVVAMRSPREAIKAGIGLLPQDRKGSGFVPDMSVAANISLASLPMFSRLGIRSGRRETAAATTLATRLDMRISGVDQPMKTLSGGTQQKAILARWLVRSVRILICDEPTRGVDVGAKEEMYELLRDFARSGGTVVIASSELSEALMCDRVLVLSRGEVIAELDHAQIDPRGDAIVRCFR